MLCYLKNPLHRPDAGSSDVEGWGGGLLRYVSESVVQRPFLCLQ